MKIKIKRLFRYQEGSETKELQPGTYKVPSEVSEYVAHIAQRWGSAELIPSKPAAKKKGRAPENKARVGK